MNHFYKVVFCKATGVFKAVPENAKSGKKSKSVSVATGVLAAGVMFSTAAIAAVGDPIASGEVEGYNAISVGETNQVKGARATATGNDNRIEGDQTTAVGSNNEIRGVEEWYNDELFTQNSDNSTIVGVQNEIVGRESIALGTYNNAYNQNVTITGARNTVDSKSSGSYGQENFVGTERVMPSFYRVDDSAMLRMTPTYAIQTGSYAYGNGNEVIGDKSHAVGNSNNVMGESNGVLGNGNTLSNDTMFIEPPRWDVRTANMERGLNQDSNGSFLVGNQNDVTANNTHAVGNQNTIRNDRNVTIGNSNRVEFLEEPIFIQPQRMSLNNDTSTAIVGEEPVFIQPQRIGMIGNNNTSTAIVGEGNDIYAAGVHIVGTENSVDQAYSYVVGAGNQVDSDNGSMFGPGSTGDGSAIMGSDNYIKSQGTAVLGSNNSVYSDSHFSVVSGSRNEVEGISSSVVGSTNSTRKDVGGAFGTFNKVTGNYGILELIENAMLEAEESEGGFQGIDTNGDGVIDIATLEELEAFEVSIIGNGSYAYGNINNIQGEGVHTVGNNNEFSGNNNKGVGNNNRIGQVGGMVGNSDAVLPTVKFYDSAAYGDLNIVNANSAQAIGNKNSLEKDFSSITGYNNTVTQGLDGELVDVTIEQQRLAGTFVSGNDNLIESHGGHVSGSGNEFQADRATLSGSENTVIGNEGHVVGNDNSVYGSSNNGFGNNNVIGKVMSGDYSSVDSSHVVGNNNTMEGNSSSAFGNENTVTGDETSVIGLSNTVSGEGSLALGNYNNTESSMVTIVGGYNAINNDYSDNAVAVGQNNDLIGNQAVAMGNNNSIEKDASGAIGIENTVAGGYDSLGIVGEGITDMGDGVNYDEYIERGSYAQGNKNDVRGDTTHVYGYYNGVLGNQASVMGANNSVSGNGTQVIGNDNTIGYNNDGMPQYGDNIAVLGSSNTVEAENSFVVGSNSVVDRGADGSLVFGSNASSSVLNGVAIGNGSTVGRENTVSFGSAGEERQLTNIADATETKDAVNLGQLNASLRDTTAGKNIAVKRTDTGYEVSTVEDMTLTSVATGNTTINNAGFTNGATTVGSTGLKVGDVTVSNAGLDNAGNRVTSVGDATLRSDAVNYGQFTDGLAGTIKSVTGDENITATTDAEKNVSLVLNKDLVADSLTAGDTVINNAGFTNGATTVGNAGLKVGDVTVSNIGLDNAGNRVTGVGTAIEGTDAVNFDQFKAGLTDTTAGKNISVKRTDTGYEVSTVEDMSLTSVTTGDTVINNAGFTNGATTVGSAGLKVGDVTVSNVGLDNAGNRVTSVGDATLRSDAVNYGQFTDGLAGTIKSVTGDENITATTDAEKNVSLVLNKDLAADSLTTGATVVNTDGVRAGDVFLSSTTGLDNAGNRVTGVGTAIEGTDAVNFDQFKAGLTDTTAGKNIAVKRTDTGYEVSTIEDMTLTSVTTGNTVINNAGFTNGATTVGSTGLKVGDVTVSNAGLDNAGNRVTSVGDATLRSDAVNYGQFTDGLAGTIKSVTGDENITATTDAEKNVSLVLNKNLVADSLTTGTTIINTDGVRAGDVFMSSASGLNNAGFTVSGVGDAVERDEAINKGQFDDATKDMITSVESADDNIYVNRDGGSVWVGMSNNISVESVSTGGGSLDAFGLTVGSVNISKESGISAGDKKVTGVANAVNRDDAVNYGQFLDGLGDVSGDTVFAGNNIVIDKDGNQASISLADDITVDSVTTGSNVLDASGLTVGGVSINDETGIYAGNMTVSGVADAVNADDAVNLGQVNAIDDRLTAENASQNTIITNNTNAINKGFNVGNGVTSNKFELGDTVDITADSNTKVTTTDTGVQVGLADDIVVTSVKTGNTVVDDSGIKVGDITVGSNGFTAGTVSVGKNGLDNGGNRVTNVGDAIEGSDAVNYDQFKAGLKDTTAGKNITVKNTDTGYEVALEDDIAVDSVLTGNALLNTNGLKVGDATYGASGMQVGDVYLGATGVRAGEVVLSNTSGLYNAGFTVSGVGNAVKRDEAVNKGQLDDALDGIQHTTVTGDANINATKNDTGYDLSLNKDLTVDSVTTGNTVVNGSGVTVGDVTLSAGGLNNGGNKVTGVGTATEGSDAVNLDQFNAALNDISPLDIKGDSNITVSKDSSGYEIGLSKDVVVDSITAGGTVVDTNGVKVGNVTLGANGLNNAGNTITGVGAGIKDDDAVNMGQLNATNAKVDKNTADITATNDRITTETGRLDAVNAAQDKVIAGKLDREEFLQDQQRQDDAIKGKADQAELDKTNVNVSNNTTNIDKNAADIKDHATELDRLEDVKADKADLDKTNANVTNNTTNIDKNAADIKDHATELDRLEDVKADKADLDKTNENVAANTDKNKDQDSALKDHQTELERLEDKKADKADIEAKADTDYVDKQITNKVEEQSNYFNEKVSSYEAQVKRDIETVVKEQAKTDMAQDVRIDQNSQMISDLGYKVENLEGKLSAGIASTVAMALMPSAMNPGEVRLAGGTGYYNGEGAIAVGLTGATESGAFTYKIAGSYTEEGGAVVGGGVSYRIW